MGGQGSNPNVTDNHSNENNQFTTEALERESEEWMEECRSILNSDEPISFQDLLAQGAMLPTPPHANADTEISPQMNSALNSALPENNDRDHGKNLIINLDDESEDDDGSEAMRQSYKRKLPDSNSRRMLVGETSRVIERREVSQEDINIVNSQSNFIDLEQPDVQVQDVQPQNGARNGTGVNAGTVPLLHQNLNPMRQGWTPQRNTHHGTQRINFVVYSPLASRNRPAQPTQYNPVPIQPNMPVPPPMQPSEMPPPYHPTYYDTDAQPFYRQLVWSNNFDNVPVPGIPMGNIPNRPTNMSYHMFPGNVASSSRNPPPSHAYLPSNVIWNPQGNFLDQFPRAPRPSQAVNNQVEAWRPPYQGPIHTAGVVRPNEIQSRARHADLWPEITMASLRQAGIPPDVALSLMTTAERARLLNEVTGQIRNALRLLRGNFDVVEVEFNNLVGENHDEHGDMRLDVDEFSYEELMVLEQTIGNVRTGLAEDVIKAHLRSRKYRTAAFGTPSENPPCCICQEEYVEGDDTAKLLCGHYFHYNCIKQWLVEKNNCPICKHTAVNV